MSENDFLVNMHPNFVWEMSFLEIRTVAFLWIVWCQKLYKRQKGLAQCVQFLPIFAQFIGANNGIQSVNVKPPSASSMSDKKPDQLVHSSTWFSSTVSNLSSHFWKHFFVHLIASTLVFILDILKSQLNSNHISNDGIQI